MDIGTEDISKLENLQNQLEQKAKEDKFNDFDSPDVDPDAVSEGSETLKQSVYLFAEMGNGKLKSMHNRLGVDEQKLATATDLLSEAILKHVDAAMFKHSVEISAALYIGSLAVQQWRIYEDVKHEIGTEKAKQKESE